MTLLTRPMIGFEQAAQSPFGCTTTPCSARFRSIASNRTERSVAFCFDADKDSDGGDTLPLSALTSEVWLVVLVASFDKRNSTLTKMDKRHSIIAKIRKFPPNILYLVHHIIIIIIQQLIRRRNMSIKWHVYIYVTTRHTHTYPYFSYVSNVCMLYTCICIFQLFCWICICMCLFILWTHVWNNYKMQKYLTHPTVYSKNYGYIKNQYSSQLQYVAFSWQLI